MTSDTRYFQTVSELDRHAPGSYMPQNPHPPSHRSLDDILTSIERREILAALHRAHGQRTLAAKALGISRSRLYRRMEALGIDPGEPGRPEHDDTR